MATIDSYVRDWGRAFGLHSPAQVTLLSGEVHDTWQLKSGGSVTIRAARLDDGDIMQALVHGLSLTSRYRRFFYAAHELPPDLLARFTHADAMQAMTLLAVVRDNDEELAVGMAQYVTDPYPERAEFAVVIADAWQRKGIATRLIRNLICIARAAGIARLEGDVLIENQAMQQLLAGLDFSIRRHADSRDLVTSARQLMQPEWECSPLAALAIQAQKRQAELRLPGM